MSEMVECVARAMWIQHSGRERFGSDAESVWRDYPDDQPSGGMPHNCKAFWQTQARAAIESMRKPTAYMRLAGGAPVQVGSAYFDDTAQLCWQAMIDEALK